MNTEIFELGKT